MYFCRLFQVTWLTKTGFIYDRNNLSKVCASPFSPFFWIIMFMLIQIDVILRIILNSSAVTFHRLVLPHKLWLLKIWKSRKFSNCRTLKLVKHHVIESMATFLNVWLCITIFWVCVIVRYPSVYLCVQYDELVTGIGLFIYPVWFLS